MAKKKSTVTAGDDPPWYAQCLDNIKKIPGGTLCSEQHCADAKRQNYMICNCVPPYLNGCMGPNPAPGCCSYNASSPVFVALPNGGCYCCCGSTTPATEVAVSKTDSMAIDQLKKGDIVYAPKDASLQQWTNAPLQFVSVSRASADNPQVSIKLRDAKGKEQNLVVGTRQLMLLPGGKFKEAGKLVPQIDQLVSSNGKATDIEDISAGTFTTFIAYIAFSAAPAKNPEGHLLSVNGFIVGDYALSLGIGDEHLYDNHAALPVAGTAAYHERYPHLR